MIIEYLGGLSEIQKEICELSLPWISDNILGKRLSKNIQLDLCGENIKPLHGLCDVVEHKSNPRWFEIVMNDELKNHEFLLCLCHEMVHVKQFARNELSFRKNSWYWKGEKWESKIQPWEIEAEEKEKSLYGNMILALPELQNHIYSFK